MKVSGHTPIVVTKTRLSGAIFSNLKQSTVIMKSAQLCLGAILFGLTMSYGFAAEPKASGISIIPVLATHSSQSQIHTTLMRSPIAKLNPKRANFKQETATQASVYLADWVLDSGDNQQMPFVIVDKKAAKVYVFDVLGQLTGAAPALLGLAVGDNSIPNIGNMALASIKPEQRTTPAGRFVAALGKNIHNKEVLWVDYDAAISLHRVVTSSPKERRLQRLESQNPLERRISYGCINVPVKFYDQVISPTFIGTNGIIYVLPDTRSVQDVFGSYSVGDRALEQ